MGKIIQCVVLAGSLAMTSCGTFSSAPTNSAKTGTDKASEAIQSEKSRPPVRDRDSQVIISAIEHFASRRSTQIDNTSTPKTQVVIERRSLGLLYDDVASIKHPNLESEVPPPTEEGLRELFPVLKKRNRAGLIIPPVSGETRSAIIALADLTDYPNYQVFYVSEKGEVQSNYDERKYPYCNYQRLRFSMPGFSNDGNRAIIQFSFKWSPSHSAVATCILEKQGESWRVVKESRVGFV